jgi:hypothetical protein
MSFSSDPILVVTGFDPNQGGKAYVGGPLATGGQGYAINNGPVVWQSYGPASKSSVFDTTWFHYEVSWGNFVATLRHLTYLKLNKNTDQDVASVFGSGWNSRTNWILKNARIAQEVYNPGWNSNLQATVGGHVNWIQIEAILR